MLIKQAVLSTLFVRAASFVPLSITPTTSSSSSRHADASVRLDANKHQPRVDLGLAKFFGLVATTSALSNGDVPTARATVKMDDSSLSSLASSTMEIADIIKVLDVSMPSSYGEM